MNIIESRRFTPCLNAVGCAFVVAVLALQEIPAHAQTSASSDSLPEIKITAERITENLQNVPISVSALSADQLFAQHVDNIEDLQSVTPGLSISDIGRSTSINIRGVGLLQTTPTSAPGVAYYINGALIPHETSLLGSYYDIGSVEVLRGPQGTLSGQNSTGGAIFLRSPEPVFREFSGYVDQTFGNHDWKRSIAAVNLPISDVLALRIAGTFNRRDSFTENTGGSSQPGNLNYSGGRMDLEFMPSERLTANLRYEYGNSDTDNFAFVPFFAPPDSNPYVISEDADSYNRQTTSRTDGEVRFDLLPTLELRALSSYQHNINHDLNDSDRTDLLPGLGVGGASTYYKIWVNEVDLISTAPGPFQWVAGGFYSNESISSEFLSYASPVTPIGPPFQNISEQTDAHSESVFGQVTYGFLDKWQVVAGARYSRDHQLENRITTFVGETSADSSSPTGRIALNYIFSNQTLLYASVAKGYKAGGNNLLASDLPFKPEKNVVEELGAKLTLLDNHLRLNSDVFLSQYDNIQIQSSHPVFIPGGPPFPIEFPITENTGKARSYGAEVEAMGLFGGLHFNGNLTYLSAKTTESVAVYDAPIDSLDTVPKGARLPFSPTWVVNAGVEYSFALPTGELTPRVQASYFSRQYATFFPVDSGLADTLINSRIVLDTQLTYTLNESWRVELFATNVADRVYVAAIEQGGLGQEGGRMYGAPRQFGVRVKWSWK